MPPKPTSFINPDTFAPARFGTINSLVGVIIPLLLIFITLAALVVLIMGAFKYLTAYGDPAKLESAIKTFQYASFGIIVVFTSFLLVRIITYVLDIPFLLTP